MLRDNRPGTSLAALWVSLSLALAMPGFAEEAVILGEGVTLEEATPIHAILADPDAFLGQTVRIEGGVLDVCPMKGCWVEVGGEGGSLRVKVEDDVIVFPADAKGRIIAAQGTVEAVEMSREEYVDWLAHLAAEKGEPFDAATADVGDGPHRTIRIRGTGARIEGSSGGAG
ncbi:MAG: DUF4920 domain-containing protein [Acidobacteriota bacterium]|nr:DUF4920 domain-containing protein [Acidobacteriota bacterium]MDH3525433.1 DUF4920 domain-containing protein [Acidobacteriota bacterium]